MNKKFLEFDSTYTFQISRKSDKKYFGNNENMFYLPPSHPLWTPPKGGFYSQQTPNVSESVVALSKDSFPAKKKIDFLAILGAWNQVIPLRIV